jgi:hypothetical protein
VPYRTEACPLHGRLRDRHQRIDLSDRRSEPRELSRSGGLQLITFCQGGRISATADYRSCGIIHRMLMGYRRMRAVGNGSRHRYMGNPDRVGIVRTNTCRNQQTTDLPRNPLRRTRTGRDHNAEFRNVAVACGALLYGSYRADGTPICGSTTNEESLLGIDPALEHRLPIALARTLSDLVSAATFDEC